MTPESEGLFKDYYASDDVRSTVGYSLRERLEKVEEAARRGMHRDFDCDITLAYAASYLDPVNESVRLVRDIARDVVRKRWPDAYWRDE